MVRTLSKHGASPAGLVAKLVGGARMFGQSGSIQIGDANINATLRALESAAIPILARDLGGNHGRRICFDVATGEIAVESGDAPLKII
jgi:chemotaxis protein CheD